MLKVLVPVDGSDNALRAVRQVAAEYQCHRDLELHLLNVQPRLDRHIGPYESRHDGDALQHYRADAALASARAVLNDARVPYHTHWAVGHAAAEICRMAERLAVNHIVMGVARKNSMTRTFEDSVSSRVLEITPVPVKVMAGDAVSPLERWGVPAGVLALIGLLWLAAD
jgi:nucleotide-binding universal stress UspA family protein